MSAKNKASGKKAAASAQQQPKSPPRRAPEPPPDEDVQYEFGRLVTREKPLCFKIELTEKTGKYEVIAFMESGVTHSVLSAPTFDIAKAALRFCQDICNNNTSDVELDIKEKNDGISSIWDGFYAKCATVRTDMVGLELHRSEAQRAKNLVGSLRTAPLVRFGTFVSEVKAIQSFQLAQKGATWAIVAIDLQGTANFCDVGGVGDFDVLSKKMDEYIKIANQQSFTPELRAQWSTASAAVVTPDAADLDNEAPQVNADQPPPPATSPSADSHAPVPPPPSATVDDADEDVDDKPAKKHEKVTSFQPGSGQKRLLSASAVADDDEDDEEEDDGEEEENKGVQLVDPAAVVKKAAPPKDGKLTIAVPSANEGGPGPVDFLKFEGNVLPNGEVEVVTQ